MAYQNVTKSQIGAAIASVITNYSGSSPLTESQAEELRVLIYEATCNIIDPDKDYPDCRL